MKKLLLITLFCMILLSVYVSAAFPSGATEYWSFDEAAGTNAKEIVEGVRNATLTNGATFKGGKLGNGVYFDGTNFADIINSNDMLIGAVNNYTITAWINYTNTWAYGQHWLANENNLDFIGALSAGANQNKTSNEIGGAITGNANEYTFDGSSWTFVTLVVNDTNTVLYINGTFSKSIGRGAIATGSWNFGYDAVNGGGGLNNVTGVLDEVGIWNRTLTPTEISDLWNNGDGVPFEVAVTSELQSPIDNSVIILETQSFSANFTASTSLVNSTLWLWNSTDDVVGTNTSSITGTINSSNLSLTDLIKGTYQWNYLACNNNNECVWASANYSLNITAFSEDAITFNSTTAETASETFIQQITTNGSTPTNQKFIYNNTQYTATLTSIDGNTYNLSSTINNIPLGDVSNNFWFNFTLGNEFSTTSNSQTVSLLRFGICNATLTIPYLNFSFKDEADLSAMTATIPTSTFVYWAGTGGLNKSLTYINSTINSLYKFCATPPDKTLNVDIYMQYKNGTTYPQRTYNPQPLSFTNSTTEKVLYLLSTADGLYVTFQVIDSAQQAISGVSVNATRTISGNIAVIGDGTTDAAGAVTFWMNPDFTHLISFTKTGYDFYSISLTPTQSSYTITLGSAITTITDYLQGVSFIMSPSANFLDNNTLYNFSYGLTSSYWSVQKFGFYLYYSNGSLIGSQHASTNGGTLSILNVNTFNESSIYLTHYYTVNSTNTTYNPVVWIIQSTEGRQFSIWHFFTDLTLYTNSGDFFGFDDFGRTLLSFTIIVMVVGGLSSKYGIRSEAAIMGILFGLVFLLDVQLGMIPRISVGNMTAIPNFVTYLTFIILVAIVIREERR